MPFAEDGNQLDPEARRRFIEMFGDKIAKGTGDLKADELAAHLERLRAERLNVQRSEYEKAAEERRRFMQGIAIFPLMLALSATCQAQTHYPKDAPHYSVAQPPPQAPPVVSPPAAPAIAPAPAPGYCPRCGQVHHSAPTRMVPRRRFFGRRGHR